MDYIIDTNYKKQNMPVEPPTPRPHEYENKGSNNTDLTMINLILSVILNIIIKELKIYPTISFKSKKKSISFIAFSSESDP